MVKRENKKLEKPSIFATVICLFAAGFMWGSSNAIARSLLIEGVNEIFLVTARVTIIRIFIIYLLSYF